ncbi:hypothetical protein [Saccharothrix sp.]|uniref:hypothetical protein n=1 Tax=Saccharothrix sp. TaxID=1873460 RepID=UPI002811E2A2|nr:hypothetical protein [Saccharothrix sp.]
MTDGVVWWDASAPAGQDESHVQVGRPLTDRQQTWLVAPYPMAQPGTPGTSFCAECSTPDSRARDRGPCHREGCHDWYASTEILPEPGTPLALLRRAQCVLWLVRGEQCYAPVSDSGLVNWSRTDVADSYEWDQDEAEHAERTAAADQLHAHQSAGALLRIAVKVEPEQDTVGWQRPSSWRHAARLLCDAASHERHAATTGGPVLGAVVRLDAVVNHLQADSTRGGESARVQALQEMTAYLARHTQGANYRVALLPGRHEHHEVVVRARSAEQATLRVLEADARYLVGDQPVPEAVREVTSAVPAIPTI